MRELGIRLKNISQTGRKYKETCCVRNIKGTCHEETRRREELLLSKKDARVVSPGCKEVRLTGTQIEISTEWLHPFSIAQQGGWIGHKGKQH